MEYQGKTVLITGAASGMGLLSAQCYAREGAKIVMVDFNAEALNREVAALKETGAQVIGCVTDVRDYAQVTAARDAAVDAFGAIDILLNFAGGAETRILKCGEEFHNQPISVIDFGIDVNLKGAIYFAHAVMQQMAKQNSGVIINLGSITGEEGSGGAVAYSTSKSALMNGTTKSLALAGAKYNIRVCCVAPGPVLTRPGMANMKTLMGRAADPQEIVDFIMYLTSEKGSFITGTSYLIDGGRHILFNK